MRWQALAWAVVVVAGVVVELNNQEATVDDAALRARANSLRTTSANLDVIGLAARFALLQQYDSLVDAEEALNREIAALQATSPPAAVVDALTAFQAAVAQRQKHLLELKAARGLLTNTERYLPVLLDDLRRAWPNDARVAEAGHAVLAWRLAHDDDDDALHHLQRVSGELKLAGGPLGAAVPHLEALVAMRRALVAITREQLIKLPLAAASNAVFLAIDDVAAAHERRAAKSRLAVLALAVLVALATLWLPERRG